MMATSYHGVLVRSCSGKSSIFVRDLYTLTIITMEIVNVFLNVHVIVSCLDSHAGFFATEMGQYGVKPLDQGNHYSFC